MYMSIHRLLVELQHILADAEKQNLDLTQNVSGKFDDFKKRKEEGTRLALSGVLQRLNQATQNDADLAPIVAQLKNTQNVSEMNKILDRLAGLVQPEEKQESKTFNQRIMPGEIRDEVTADLLEAQKCMKNACYRSAVILCGRVLETALHRKYFEATGNDLLEKAPGTGLGNLIAKLSEKGVQLDPGLTNQIHLINQVRVYSVHKKQDAFSPTQNQAQAIVLYTIDVLEKLFRHD